MNGAALTIDPEAAQPPANGSRSAERSNIFIVATLYSDAGSAPVRIRNLSCNGALVEGGVLPPVGTQIRLSRGSLTVSGRVVRQSGGRAGVKFDASINVAEWMTRASRSVGQQRVDEIVHHSKRGQAPLSPAPASAVPVQLTDGELADELARLKGWLDSVGEELSGDPAVAARYLAKLQLLDAAAQALGRLASALAQSPRS